MIMRRWKPFAALYTAIVSLILLSGCGGGGGGGSSDVGTTGGSTTTTTTATATPTPSATATPTPTPTPTPSGTVAIQGLAELNAIRALAGLPAVTEDPTLSSGAQLHSIYMVKNNVITHAEDPSLPFFTDAGNTSGQHSNVFATTAPTLTITTAIDSLMVGPFHGIGFIDPKLRTTGFGLYSENKGNPAVIQSAADVDVLSGLAPTVPAGITFPIVWPGPGAVSPFARYSGNETPDPLSSLPGFTAPTGAPIYVQLGPGNVTPSVTAFSVTVNGTAVAVGEFDQTNYTNSDANSQTLGRQILAGRSAIVLMPRQPLPQGAQVAVSVTTNGQTIAWTFTVSANATSR